MLGLVFERLGRGAVIVLALQALVALAMLGWPLFLHLGWGLVPAELVALGAVGIWWWNVRDFRRKRGR